MGFSVSLRLPGSLLPVEPFSRVPPTYDRVVFCTGGAGTIGSAQVRALVHLRANACIVGRNVEKTQQMAVEIGTARPSLGVLESAAWMSETCKALRKTSNAV